VKAGWETAELSKLCKVFTDGNWIESKDQSSDGIRLVQTGNVGFGEFKDRRDKARFIDEETFDRLKCFEILPGDCLISRLPDPVGRACQIPETGDKMITAVDCSIVRAEPKKLDRDYFIYYSQSRQYLKDVDALCSGTTRRRISRKNLGKTKIPLPPLEEQKRIVAVLDAAFEGLTRARTHIETNLQNARELFERAATTALTKTAESCPLVELDSVANLDRGHNPPKKDFVYEKRQGYVRFYQIRDRKSDKFAVYVPDTKKLHRVNPTEILMTAYRHIGEVYRGADGAFNVALCKLSSKSEEMLLNDYLFAIIPTDYVKGELLRHSERSLIPSMSVKHLQTIKIPLPDVKLQSLLVAQLSDLDTQSAALEAHYRTKLADLDDLRQSLLARAFAGALT
jgi:type I restriction enzyme S subunit